MKKLLSILLSAVFTVSLLTVSAGAENAEEESKGVVILHTNDVHCGIYEDDSTLSIAALAAYKARLESEGYDVILADAGDFVQGGAIGTLSDGEYPLEIMNKLGYDVAVPGNHEFDFGMDNFFKLAGEAQFPYLSANFTNLETGEHPLNSYTIINADGINIGFVGITTPETTSSSRPSNFQNESGEFIYGFCNNSADEFYSLVQASVDAACADGADYVVALGHVGDYVYDDRWSSVSIIENVSGIDLFIDGHSHSVLNETVTDPDGNDVLLVSTGTKLVNIGQVTLNVAEETISAEESFVNKGNFELTSDENSAEYKAYEEMTAFIADIEGEYSELISTAVAKTEVDLTVDDPDTGERAVRSAETNMGDLCADAYRAVTGADIAFINGGGVRAGISAGDITYGGIIDVQPFGNSICEVEATGQQILDCLEMGVIHCPEEDGAFNQVSGLTYEIHTYVPSSAVTDNDGNFISVDGEYRVKNVLVNGEPLDLEKTYTLASHNYMLESCGGGMTMFKDCEFVAKEITLDNQALIDYITVNLGGVVGDEYSDPRGGGRIAVVAEKPADNGSAEENDSDKAPATGGTSATGAAAVMLVFAALAAAVRKK